MNAVAPIRQGLSLTPAQVALIKRTVAKDCDADEFSLYMAAADRAKLDPLRKQISALVFSKNDPKKRQLAIITTIDGMRVIAARHGDYRPMETPPVIEYSEAAKNEKTNPLGIVSCEVRCWKRYGAEWHPVAGQAHWDEFVPLEQEWAFDPEQNKRTPSGPKVLKDSSPWRRMGRVMIAKVAEAQALRRGWPDDMSGLYADEELQRAQVIDVASEVVADFQEQQRITKVNPKEATLFVFAPSAPLEPVPRGEIADRVLAFIRAAATAQELIDFRDRNAESLRTFWAWAPNDCLEVKKAMEKRIAELTASKPSTNEGAGAPQPTPTDAASPASESAPSSLSPAEVKKLQASILRMIGECQTLREAESLPGMFADDLARAPADVREKAEKRFADARAKFEFQP